LILKGIVTAGYLRCVNLISGQTKISDYAGIATAFVLSGRLAVSKDIASASWTKTLARGIEETGLIGSVDESAIDEVSEPLNVGSREAETGSGRAGEDVDEMLERGLKRPPNFFVTGDGAAPADAGDVKDGVALVGVSVEFHNLKPHRDAVLGLGAETGGGFVPARTLLLVVCSPTLFSAIKVRSARTHISDASLAS